MGSLCSMRLCLILLVIIMTIKDYLLAAFYVLFTALCGVFVIKYLYPISITTWFLIAILTNIYMIMIKQAKNDE